MLSSQPSQMTYPLTEDAWTTVYSKSLPARYATANSISIKKTVNWCAKRTVGLPLRDGIPVLLENEARALSLDEKHA